ncbi:CDF family Co(II)/Ni(II) efflux transporter DmeF [Cereibacter johrii]|uniref:Cation diffusion facilitator family transporter n=1 Tax=Cereibacter johrii TaxID=445629 RepID=A0ABX5J7H6_9RHOB|nr:CDF family Co(II)/Ni(II) efflux transporter DmeF [Cereibacter johrii]ODM43836.1 cation transporter [Cereibacter johrii]PTM78163.1 cation diffusion facilitator family transporter [Cereibacter johrii]
MSDHAAHPHDHDHDHGHGHDHDHDHVFLGARHARNERRTWAVIALTSVMMVIEIAAGTLYGSMALVADGWHMSTHAAALLITALAYLLARRHARDRRFTFGTGKFGDLAGFASAVVLAVVALLIGWESAMRLLDPVPIDFGQATVVAVIGLLVNLGSALLLHEGHAHGHDHGHDHGHGHGRGHGHGHDHGHGHGPGHGHGHGHGHAHSHHAQDNNLRAAYLHVLADALTSVLAIAALIGGRIGGWVWLDPLIGLLGALVIARWSLSLLRSAGGVLVDFIPEEEELPAEIREALETGDDRITDLHVWQLGPGHHGAIVALRSADPQPPDHYRRKLNHLHEISHLTLEVRPA